VYNNLAMTLKRQGEAREALDLQERVVAYIVKSGALKIPTSRMFRRALNGLRVEVRVYD
jgi:hypothetical protein